MFFVQKYKTKSEKAQDVPNVVDSLTISNNKLAEQYQKVVNELTAAHSETMKLRKSIYNTSVKNKKKFDKQEEEIKLLKKQILELNRQIEKLLLK
jgi:uncharacterized coiled-coil DUF342 family protein